MGKKYNYVQTKVLWQVSKKLVCKSKVRVTASPSGNVRCVIVLIRNCPEIANWIPGEHLSRSNREVGRIVSWVAKEDYGVFLSRWNLGHLDHDMAIQDIETLGEGVINVLDPFMREKHLAFAIRDLFGCIAGVPSDIMVTANFPDRACVGIGYRWDKNVSCIQLHGCTEGQSKKGENGEKESRERSHWS